MSDTGDVSGQMFGVVQCAAFNVDYQFQSGCLDCDYGHENEMYNSVMLS